MKRKYLFTALLVATITGLLSTAALAFQTDSGEYYNPRMPGEGMVLLRNNNLTGGDYVHFTFYTYEGEQGCYHIAIPFFERVTEGNCHEPRWFTSGAALLLTDANGKKTATGQLLCGMGTDYPEGLPVVGDPFTRVLGDAYRCADFFLESIDSGGWRLAFDRYGTILPEDDPIFGTIYEFTDVVFLGPN